MTVKSRKLVDKYLEMELFQHDQLKVQGLTIILLKSKNWKWRNCNLLINSIKMIYAYQVNVQTVQNV